MDHVIENDDKVNNSNSRMYNVIKVWRQYLPDHIKFVEIWVLDREGIINRSYFGRKESRIKHMNIVYFQEMKRNLQLIAGYFN